MSDLPAGAEPVELDARGLLCPQPVIRLARASRGLPPGSVLQVLADDPAARYDIPAWCRLKGHSVELTEGIGHAVFRVVLGQPNSS